MNFIEFHLSCQPSSSRPLLRLSLVMLQFRRNFITDEIGFSTFLEITAKVFEGYEGGGVYHVDEKLLSETQGRDYDYRKTDIEQAAEKSRAALQESGATGAPSRKKQKK